MTKNAHNEANLLSEDSGLRILMAADPRLVAPTLEEKKKLLSHLKYPTIYTRSFDLVKLNVDSLEMVNTKNDFILIEVKVTSKKLEDFPRGFFFGLTQNEETLLKELDGSYLLCLVSIHPETQKSIYLNYDALQDRIRNKRIQYQINL